MPTGPVRGDPLGHPAQQPIAKLALTPGPVQAAGPRRLHIPPDRLTIHPRQPRYRTQPLTPQPQPQHLFDLVHPDLPERHTAALQIR